MYAVEFDANIMDGRIEIPAEYQKQFSTPHNVKVILMKKEAAHTAKPHNAAAQDSGFGSLSRYANPTLWEQESRAWERAVVEKHETR